MPANKDQSLSIEINGLTYNLTTLHFWNYTLFPNSTLSNESSCWLVFGRYQPILLSNGTFLNAKSCYLPINPLSSRGILGLIAGILFASTLLFTTINLRKHGRSFLPREKQRHAVERRWTWYWMLVVAAVGMMSGFMAIDVDRDYVLGLPMVLQSFFHTLTLPLLLACVWESVRHWGTWQLRQIRDADPFAFRQKDARAQVELYLPITFYAVDWLVFFVMIPRSWNFTQMQRSFEQELRIAMPNALDTRFQVGSAAAILCVVLIVTSFLHNRYYYYSSSSKSQKSARDLLKPVLVTVLTSVLVAYAMISAWSWQLSAYRKEVNTAILYGLGYLPTLLTLVILNYYGWREENEDKELIAQRALRSDTENAALLRSDARSKKSKIALPNNFLPSFTHSQDLEMSSLPQRFRILSDDEDESGSWWWQRPKKVHQDSDDDAESTEGSGQKRGAKRVAGTSMFLDNDEASLQRKQASSRFSDSLSSGVTLRSAQTRPQVIRSMIDIQ